MASINNNQLKYNFKNKNSFNYVDNVKIKIYYKDYKDNTTNLNIKFINKQSIKLKNKNKIIIDQYNIPEYEFIDLTNYFINYNNSNLTFDINGNSNLYNHINSSNIKINYNYPTKDYLLTIYANNNINIALFNIEIKKYNFPLPIKIKEITNFYINNNLNNYFSSQISNNLLTYKINYNNDEYSTDFITLSYNNNLYVNSNLLYNSNIDRKIDLTLTVYNFYNISNIFKYSIIQKACIFSSNISIDFNNLFPIKLNLNNYIKVPNNNEYEINNVIQTHTNLINNYKYFNLSYNSNLTLYPDYRNSKYDINIISKNINYNYSNIFKIHISDNTIKNKPNIYKKIYNYTNSNLIININQLFKYEHNIIYDYYINNYNNFNSYLLNNCNLLDNNLNCNIAIINNSNLIISNYFRNSFYFFNLYIHDTTYKKINYITFNITETNPIKSIKNFSNIIDETNSISSFNLNSYFLNLTNEIITYNINKNFNNINIINSNLIIEHNKFDKYEIIITAYINKYSYFKLSKNILIDETINLNNYLNIVPIHSNIFISDYTYNLDNFYLLNNYNYVLKYRINKFQYYDNNNFIYLLKYNNSNITYNNNQIFNIAFLNVKYKFINSNIENIISSNLLNNYINYNNNYFYFYKISNNIIFNNNFSINIKYIQKNNFVNLNNNILSINNFISYIFPKKFEIITTILYNKKRNDIYPTLIKNNIIFKFNELNLNKIINSNIIYADINDEYFYYNLLNKYNFIDYNLKLSNYTCNTIENNYIDNFYNLNILNLQNNQTIKYVINEELTFYLTHFNLDSPIISSLNNIQTLI
jgi:hypothetical protein